MLNLVWKDVLAARKLLLLVIPLGGIQLAVLASVPPIYPIAALTFASLLAVGSIILEETQRTELLWNSLPVTRDAVVTARYFVALIGMTFGLALGWVVAQAAVRPVSVGSFGPATFTSFSAHAFMFGMLVFATAIFLPLHFRLGPGRAVMFFLAIALGTVVLVSLLTQAILLAMGYPSPFFDPEAWSSAGPTLSARFVEWVEERLGWLLSLFVACAILALGASWTIARRLYATRDL